MQSDIEQRLSYGVKTLAIVYPGGGGGGGGGRVFDVITLFVSTDLLCLSCLLSVPAAGLLGSHLSWGSKVVEVCPRIMEHM